MFDLSDAATSPRKQIGQPLTIGLRSDRDPKVSPLKFILTPPRRFPDQEIISRFEELVSPPTTQGYPWHDHLIRRRV